jgi:mannonate dehydratase
MKLGCQSGPSNEDHINYLARFGVESFCGAPKIGGDRLSTVDEIKTLADLATKWKVSLDCIEPPILASSYIGREKHPAIMLPDSPERDRDFEALQTYIKVEKTKWRWTHSVANLSSGANSR